MVNFAYCYGQLGWLAEIVQSYYGVGDPDSVGMNLPEGHIVSLNHGEKGVIEKSLKKVRQGFRLFENIEISLICSEEKYHLKIREIADLVVSCGGSVIGYRRVDFPKENLYLIAPR